MMQASSPKANPSTVVKLAMALILLIQLVKLSNSAAHDESKYQDQKKNLARMDETPNDDPVMAPLIDWKTYTKLYNKNYSSLAQQITRQKLFIVKKIMVFLTLTKFKFNNISYYLVINRFSDLTPQEERRKLSGDAGEYPSDDEGDDDDTMQDDQIEHILQADLEDQMASQSTIGGRRGGAQTKSTAGQRFRRSLETTNRLDSSKSMIKSNNKLDITDLVRVPSSEGSDNNQADEAKLNIKWKVPSNNPHYVPVELITRGTGLAESTSSKPMEDIPTDQIEKIDKIADSWLSFRMPILGSLGDITTRTYNWVSDGLASFGSSTDITEDNNDQVIKDWRDTGCIAPPYDQGECNSCYAVSSMAFLEWAFCMSQDRVLTPLSAQYMVNCGRQFVSEANSKLKLEFYGCNRGRSRQAMFFVKEYGAELELHMPYLGEEDECPVDPNTPLKHKGYIRPNVKQHIRMSNTTKQLETAMNHGPIIVNFREPIDFMAYGGGMVEGCYQRGGHAMLIVGHGVENDKPYLLIKNSFGTDWGMGGYFKFNRKFTYSCIKDYILPRVSFPSKKAQIRRMKAYDASRVNYGATQIEEAGEFDVHLDKLTQN